MACPILFQLKNKVLSGASSSSYLFVQYWQSSQLLILLLYFNFCEGCNSYVCQLFSMMVSTFLQTVMLLLTLSFFKSSALVVRRLFVEIYRTSNGDPLAPCPVVYWQGVKGKMSGNNESLPVMHTSKLSDM